MKPKRIFWDTITDEGVEYQLVPPNQHMQNAAKRIIRI